MHQRQKKEFIRISPLLRYINKKLPYRLSDRRIKGTFGIRTRHYGGSLEIMSKVFYLKLDARIIEQEL